MGWFDKVKEAFSDNAGSNSQDGSPASDSPKGKIIPADDLDIEVYEGQVMQFNAMSYCLTDLYLDGEMDIEKLIPELSESAIEYAKSLYLTEANFDGLDENAISLHLKNEWLLYYADALMVIVCGAHEFLPTDENDLSQTDLTHEAITDLNETLCAANGVLHNAFCSFMHYSHKEMTPSDIVDCVSFAQESDEITIEGKSALDWFPLARALKPDADENENAVQNQASANQNKPPSGPSL
tara:strand:+ start:151091 stop:151807 length:717 start_codon:yes stop_codon:yes gene_type:complete